MKKISFYKKNDHSLIKIFLRSLIHGFSFKSILTITLTISYIFSEKINNYFDKFSIDYINGTEYILIMIFVWFANVLIEIFVYFYNGETGDG